MNITKLLIAQSILSPGTLALLIPIVAILGSMGLGLIHSLAEHQRKMAELLRTGMPQNNDLAVQQLTEEVRALRESLAAMNDKVNAAVLASDRNQPILGHTDDQVQA